MVVSDRDATNDYERKLLTIVREHGWQITSVFDPDGVEPAFSYSIGIHHSLGQPELIILGLSIDIAREIINLYGKRVRDHARTYRINVFVDDLINGYDVFLLDISSSPLKKARAASASWFYQSGAFPMFQCVWPSVDGNWPWEPGQAKLLLDQPLLSDFAPPQ